MGIGQAPAALRTQEQLLGHGCAAPGYEADKGLPESAHWTRAALPVRCSEVTCRNAAQCLLSLVQAAGAGQGQRRRMHGDF